MKINQGRTTRRMDRKPLESTTMPNFGSQPLMSVLSFPWQEEGLVDRANGFTNTIIANRKRPVEQTPSQISLRWDFSWFS